MCSFGPRSRTLFPRSRPGITPTSSPVTMAQRVRTRTRVPSGGRSSSLSFTRSPGLFVGRQRELSRLARVLGRVGLVAGLGLPLPACYVVLYLGVVVLQDPAIAGLDADGLGVRPPDGCNPPADLHPVARLEVGPGPDPPAPCLERGELPAPVFKVGAHLHEPRFLIGAVVASGPARQGASRPGQYPPDAPLVGL